MPKAFNDLSARSQRRILRNLRQERNAAEAHNLHINEDIPIENNVPHENIPADNAAENPDPQGHELLEENLVVGQYEADGGESSSPHDSDADEIFSEDGEEEPDANSIFSGDGDENHVINEDHGVRENEDAHGNEGDDHDFEDSDTDDDVPFDFNQFNGRGRDRLYAGASITVVESLCLILSVALKHNLNNSCVADIMNIINLHCPNQQLRRITWSRYKRFFSFTNRQANKNYYCPNCYELVASANVRCNVCQMRPSYFLQVPLIPQLSQLFQRDNFLESLQHRFHRQKQNEGFIEDIYDASLYQQHYNNGFLSEPNNISFLWNTDGAPVYKSKNYSIWPFYLSINELPFKLRYKRQNVLLAGLWFGRGKPNANLYMKSFQRDLTMLYQGVQIQIPRNRPPILVRALLLAGTCDLPAKCTFLNFSQYNSESGCAHCETVGSRVRLPTGNGLQVYNYERNFVKRNVERTERYAVESVHSNVPVHGVKGPTMLCKLMPDFLSGMAIDSMHNLGGIMKRLLRLWFDAKFRGSVFSMRHVLPVVDAVLLTLRPPSFIHRMPRSIEDLCHWKTSELHVWLFYYAPIVLREIVRPETYNHFMKLVAGLSYLSCTSISNDMINLASHLLHRFVKDYETIYGLRYMTINVHLLLHLSDQVRMLGPLWISSCFGFENLNALLLKSVHGNTDLDSQIIRNQWQVFCSAKLLESLNPGTIKDFCLGSGRKFRVLLHIVESCYAVGYYVDLLHLNELIEAALRSSHVDYHIVQKYCRLFKGKMMYISESYSRNVKTRSSFCIYQMNAEKLAGNIICFIKVCQECAPGGNCDCIGQHYAVMRKVALHEPLQAEYADDRLPVNLQYLFKCNLTDVFCVVPVACLITVFTCALKVSHTLLSQFSSQICVRKVLHCSYLRASKNKV